MEETETMSDRTNISKSFTDLLGALDLKDQRKALRGAMRREGNRLKKTAAAKLRGSGIGQGARQKLSKGIRLRVYPEKYGAGLLVSVKPQGKRGFHHNRQGLEKPVLMWAEDGTGHRRTKTKTKFFVRKRKGHPTGRMKRYGFMRRTEELCADSVGRNLFNDFRKNIERAVRKKGLF